MSSYNIFIYFTFCENVFFACAGNAAAAPGGAGADVAAENVVVYIQPDNVEMRSLPFVFS